MLFWYWIASRHVVHLLPWSQLVLPFWMSWSSYREWLWAAEFDSQRFLCTCWQCPVVLKFFTLRLLWSVVSSAATKLCQNKVSTLWLLLKWVKARREPIKCYRSRICKNALYLPGHCISDITSVQVWISTSSSKSSISKLCRRDLLLQL